MKWVSLMSNSDFLTVKFMDKVFFPCLTGVLVDNFVELFISQIPLSILVQHCWNFLLCQPTLGHCVQEPDTNALFRFRGPMLPWWGKDEGEAYILTAQLKPWWQEGAAESEAETELQQPMIWHPKDHHLHWPTSFCSLLPWKFPEPSKMFLPSRNKVSKSQTCGDSTYPNHNASNLCILLIIFYLFVVCVAQGRVYQKLFTTWQSRRQRDGEELGGVYNFLKPIPSNLINFYQIESVFKRFHNLLRLCYQLGSKHAKHEPLRDLTDSNHNRHQTPSMKKLCIYAPWLGKGLGPDKPMTIL